MKTLVLIVCLVAMIYAANPELQKFYDITAQCSKELNKPTTDPDVAFCLLQKNNLMDKDNKYILEKGLALYDHYISDEAKRNQAKEIIRKCYYSVGYDETKPETNEAQTRKGVKCAMPAYALIDKL